MMGQMDEEDLEWKDNPKGGNLCYVVDAKHKDLVPKVCERMRNEEPLWPLLQKLGLAVARDWRPVADTPPAKSVLPVIYSDLEPDDVMAIAQLLQLQADSRDSYAPPLPIFGVDFADKDKGCIFEKKLLMAATMLGSLRDPGRPDPCGIGIGWLPLTPAPATAAPAPAPAEAFPSEVALHKRITESREKVLEAICTWLEESKCEEILLLDICPGRGNLAAIVEVLKRKGKWPLKGKTWRVVMYTGSHNMRYTIDADFDALAEIMRYSKEPLADVSRFPFFGGDEALPCSRSHSSFAPPSFAKDLSRQSPFLAAVLKSIDEEFNAELIDPGHKRLFQGSTLDGEEQQRFDDIKAKYRMDNDIQAYARSFVEDPGLMAKVANYKKNTMMSFAYGSSDSPLCDQILFLYLWMKEKHPDWLAPAAEGVWVCDRRSGFTSVEPKVEPRDGKEFLGVQPALAPSWVKDEQASKEMRRTIHEQTLTYMRSLTPSLGKAPVAVGKAPVAAPRDSRA